MDNQIKKAKALKLLTFISAIVVGAIGFIFLTFGLMFLTITLKSTADGGASFGDVLKYLYTQGNLSILFEPVLKPIAVYGGLSVLLFAISSFIELPDYECDCCNCGDEDEDSAIDMDQALASFEDSSNADEKQTSEEK